MPGELMRRDIHLQWLRDDRGGPFSTDHQTIFPPTFIGSRSGGKWHGGAAPCDPLSTTAHPCSHTRNSKDELGGGAERSGLAETRSHLITCTEVIPQSAFGRVDGTLSHFTPRQQGTLVARRPWSGGNRDKHTLTSFSYIVQLIIYPLYTQIN